METGVGPSTEFIDLINIVEDFPVEFVDLDIDPQEIFVFRPAVIEDRTDPDELLVFPDFDRFKKFLSLPDLFVALPDFFPELTFLVFGGMPHGSGGGFALIFPFPEPPGGLAGIAYFLLELDDPGQSIFQFGLFLRAFPVQMLESAEVRFDAGQGELFHPGSLPQFLQMIGFSLVFPFEADSHLGSFHPLFGAGKKLVQTNPEVFVPKKDKGQEKKDQAEEEIENPIGQSFPSNRRRVLKKHGLILREHPRFVNL
jgi:hypothetical protein